MFRFVTDGYDFNQGDFTQGNGLILIIFFPHSDGNPPPNSDNIIFSEVVGGNLRHLNSSGIVSLTASAAQSLTSPTNLKVTQDIGSPGNRIYLTWEYGSDRIDGFKMERKTPSGSWTEIPTRPAPGDRFYIDTDLNPFATYSYRIRAYRGTDDSDFSNEDTCFQVVLLTQNCGRGDGSSPCTQPVRWPLGQGMDNKILAGFLPEASNKLPDVARKFGYNHFNWISNVMYLPASVTEFYAFNGTQPLTTPPPFLAPPPGGYTYHLADFLPYYWDEQIGYDPDYFINSNISENGSELDFEDHPHTSQLGQADYIQFATTLVGVPDAVGSLSSPTSLVTFVWRSNNLVAGVGRLAGVNSSTTSTAGGIFNVQLVRNENLPLDVRRSLIQAGVQGLNTAPKIDKDAPMTAAFLSGPQGANGWYTGPVSITLIATDIDGASDVASTSYSVAGGPQIPYTNPFSISADGVHTIQFGSVDLAGNVETPRPTQILKIDKTTPVVSAAADPKVLWPPNNKMVAVTVSGT